LAFDETHDLPTGMSGKHASEKIRGRIV